MKVILIRHGIAVDRAENVSDSNRELTKEGRKKMKQIAHGLHQFVEKIDQLASSPLVRATQTTELVAQEFGGIKFSTLAALSPAGEPKGILDWLKAHKHADVVVLVGHEPNLSLFASWSLTGLPESFIDFKKGGVCVLQFGAAPAAGHAKLLSLLTPSQLRDM